MQAPANATDAERILWEQLDGSRLPGHVAIIMDGNGRWACSKGLSRVKGHKAGVRAIRRAVDNVLHLGLNAITIYAFSTENWGRPEFEVSVLMTLLRQFVRIERDRLMEKNVRLRVLGDQSRLPAPVQRAVEQVISDTSGNSRLDFNIAINYGGRDEILRAVRKLAADRVAPDAITEASFRKCLYTHDLSDPDLLIRTSGELRISNFLLWQLAYTELYFTEVYWPDFDTSEMLKALLAYQRRTRRFGGVDGD